MTQGLLKTAVSRIWIDSKLLSGLLRRAKINPKSAFAKQLAFAVTQTSVGSSSYSKHMIPAVRSHINRMSAVTKSNSGRALAEVEAVADQHKIGR